MLPGFFIAWEVGQVIENTQDVGAPNWMDPQLWYFVVVFVMALLAKHLVSAEPLDKKRLAGEAILSIIGAIAFWAAGLLQGMSVLQMIFFGSMSALGGIRSIEWLIKIASATRHLSNLSK